MKVFFKLNFLSINFFASIVPVIVIVIAFYFIAKRKYDEEHDKSKIGRKAKKDHLGVVIKEYLKIKNRTGLEIRDFFVFERPDKKKLRELFGEAESLKNKEKKGGFKKKKDDGFPLEEYFDQLEEETAQMNKDILSLDSDLSIIKKHRKNKVKLTPRRRYVIIFRVYNSADRKLGTGEAIEAELFKNIDPEEVLRDKLLINKELDYQKELSGILPLKIEQELELEKKKKREEKIRLKKERKIRKKEKKEIFYSNLKKLLQIKGY